MERCFHNRFYKPQPEVTIADLMNMKKMVEELTIDFIERFIKAGSHCSVQFPEVECAAMATRNMHSRLKEKLVAQEYGDLSQLASKANQIEQFIHEKGLQRANKGRGSHWLMLMRIMWRPLKRKLKSWLLRYYKGKLIHVWPWSQQRIKVLLGMKILSTILIYQKHINFRPFDKGPENSIERGAQDSISRRIKRKEIHQVA